MLLLRQSLDPIACFPKQFDVLDTFVYIKTLDNIRGYRYTYGFRLFCSILPALISIRVVSWLILYFRFWCLRLQTAGCVGTKSQLRSFTGKFR